MKYILLALLTLLPVQSHAIDHSSRITWNCNSWQQTSLRMEINAPSQRIELEVWGDLLRRIAKKGYETTVPYNENAFEKTPEGYVRLISSGQTESAPVAARIHIDETPIEEAEIIHGWVEIKGEKFNFYGLTPDAMPLCKN